MDVHIAWHKSHHQCKCQCNVVYDSTNHPILTASLVLLVEVMEEEAVEAEVVVVEVLMVEVVMVEVVVVEVVVVEAVLETIENENGTMACLNHSSAVIEMMRAMSLMWKKMMRGTK